MILIMKRITGVLSGMVLGLAVAASSQVPAGRVSDAEWRDALNQVTEYRFGENRNVLGVVSEMVHAVGTDVVAVGRLEAMMLDRLGSPGSVDGKRFLCRQLRQVGSSASIPMLESLLGDPDLADMARFALEGISGEEVDAALLRAVQRLSGRERIGVVNSLGHRGYGGAIPVLRELASNADSTLGAVAVDALKKIPDEKAIDALLDLRLRMSEPIRSRISDALVQCAGEVVLRGFPEAARRAYRACYAPEESLAVQAAALQGLLKVVPRDDSLALGLEALVAGPDVLRGVVCRHLSQMPGGEVTLLLASQVVDLPTDAKPFMLRILADRGDRRALSAILPIVRNEQEPERLHLAALEALGQVGSAAEVPLLVEWLDDGQSARGLAARDALTRMRGAEVDRRILECGAARRVSTQVELLRILAGRNAVEVVPELLRCTTDPSVSVRVAAYQTLGVLTGDDQLQGLIDRLLAADPDSCLPAAAAALSSVIARVKDADASAEIMRRAFERSPSSARLVLLSLSSELGNARLLPAIREALSSEEPEIRDAAVRALSEWPTTDPADDVLEIARASDNRVHRLLALRSYLRMADVERRSAPAVALSMYQAAHPLVDRAEEKRLVLSGLGNLPRTEALSLVLGHLEEDDVRREAAEAAIRIATELAGRHPDESRAALEHVIRVIKDEALEQRARESLRKVLQDARRQQQGRT